MHNIGATNSPTEMVVTDETASSTYHCGASEGNRSLLTKPAVQYIKWRGVHIHACKTISVRTGLPMQRNHSRHKPDSFKMKRIHLSSPILKCLITIHKRGPGFIYSIPLAGNCSIMITKHKRTVYLATSCGIPYRLIRLHKR